MDTLGQLLKTAREKKGWTRVFVSEQLGWGRGCFYNHLENTTMVGAGHHARVPTPAALERLSEVLGISYKKLGEAAIERLVANKRRHYFGD